MLHSSKNKKVATDAALTAMGFHKPTATVVKTKKGSIVHDSGIPVDFFLMHQVASF